MEILMFCICVFVPFTCSINRLGGCWGDPTHSPVSGWTWLVGWIGQLSLMVTTQASSPALPWLANAACSSEQSQFSCSGALRSQPPHSHRQDQLTGIMQSLSFDCCRGHMLSYSDTVRVSSLASPLKRVNYNILSMWGPLSCVPKSQLVPEIGCDLKLHNLKK